MRTEEESKMKNRREEGIRLSWGENSRIKILPTEAEKDRFVPIAGYLVIENSGYCTCNNCGADIEGNPSIEAVVGLDKYQLERLKKDIDTILSKLQK